MLSQTFPWHPLPSSPSKATCDTYLIQAGTLDLPKDMVLLPGPNEPNKSADSSGNENGSDRVFMPDYVFLLHHKPSDQHYLFDLGMRTDLESLPPLLKEHVLPIMKLAPKNPADILRRHGSAAQQPEQVKAVFVSHLHFDHIGDGAKDFKDAEIWVGPTACTYARPGYPKDERAAVLGDNLPTDGSRKIVEPIIPDSVLREAGDAREGLVEKGKKEGKYEAVELREPKNGWIALGAFDRGYDLFGDGSTYLIDAPGHCAGHMMLLVRVKVRDGEEDDFVVLAGDCFHHASLLADPRLTARPPYSKSTMHAEPEKAMETMWRTRAFAAKEHVWVMGAHDGEIGQAIQGGKEELEGLVLLNEWRDSGWKRPLQAS
jgi:glyoxylase-like metal-dependent hydrolase (beta-lactamase superfamily II)